MKFTVLQFQKRFPTSDACLEEIKQLRFADFTCPKCGRHNMLTKIAGRPQYACPCGYQVAPLAGTIFHKSSTDLRTWFYAMYLMTQTRAGISAKQLERETGVTYKTAWRMFREIRRLMAEDGGDLLKGVVEVDEAYFQGNANKNTRLRGTNRYDRSEMIMGFVERGGRARVKHLNRLSAPIARQQIAENIDPAAIINTDQAGSYRHISDKMGRKHMMVNHKISQYVDGPAHTQNVENFWSNLKRGIYGVYRHCGPEYLEMYAWEYAWRYSNRKSEVPMFELLLRRAA